MAKKSSWVVGLAVAVAAFHVSTRRVDTGDRAPVAASGPGAIALSAPAEGPAPAEPRMVPELPAKAPADAATEVQASASLPAGEDPASALELFKLSRARTVAREEALRRLPAVEAAAAGQARFAREAGAGHEERVALTKAYLACGDPARRAGYRARLDELCADLVFSPRPADGAEIHVVKPGDSLAKIAAKFLFPVEGIQAVNRLKTTSLRVGERLKVPRGPVEVLVVKSEFRLAALFGGLYAREYPIGTGKEGCTPEATFTIAEKIKEPTWHSREGVFPFGHPKNILGTRWLGFRDTPEHRGFGIHGTAFPDSIGKEESSGCVRMRNGDVEELFGLVPKGAVVTIVR